jgi:hypothetical protein
MDGTNHDCLGKILMEGTGVKKTLFQLHDINDDPQE